MKLKKSNFFKNSKKEEFVMKCGINLKLSKIKENIISDVKNFKERGFSAGEVSEFINNKCYAFKKFEAIDLSFKSDEEEQNAVEIIEHAVQNTIISQFYEEYNTADFNSPILKKITADSPYISQRYGNVIETEFTNLDNIDGKEVEVEGICSFKNSTLISKFTDDGHLISTCKKKKL